MRELRDVTSGLRRSYLFESLSSAALEPLAAVVTTRQLVRGETLLRVLLTLGGVLSPGEVAAPANTTVRGFRAHSAVLPYMAAVVTHAGMSTVATALGAGLPMVCLPQGRDQPLNASRVEELGAGLMLAPDAAPGELAAAVRTVLSDRRYRAAAQDLAANAEAVGNGELATDLVDALVGAATPNR